jgi:hypothetical protein
MEKIKEEKHYRDWDGRKKRRGLQKWRKTQ